jgi:hypothetical protein
VLKDLKDPLVLTEFPLLSILEQLRRLLLESLLGYKQTVPETLLT